MLVAKPLSNLTVYYCFIGNAPAALPIQFSQSDEKGGVWIELMVDYFN
jgi:hypothetical protein